ncbi:50S ribosomal protein L2 [Streptomyces heliomycini]
MDTKRAYRVIDFRRHDKDGVPAKVAHIEYDPNRTARIALLHYADARSATSSPRATCSRATASRTVPGPTSSRATTWPSANIPVGTTITRSSSVPVAAPSFARSAGASVQLLAKEGSMAHLRMPSGEIRLVDQRCRATVGEVGNAEQSNINWGKAGRKRWLGVPPDRPWCRHEPGRTTPHGGGEGRTSGGRHPVSPWGKKEGRTRSPKKASNKYIVRRRKTNKKR